jgi:hypothetical protein
MDPSVPAESSRQWQRRLLAAGVSADYIEFPAVRHNAWDAAYRGGSIFDWFDRFRREGNPQHVHFATRSERYRTAYWVRIDAFVPGALASLEAVRAGTEIRVETKEVDAFTLATTARTVTIDGGNVRIRPSASLSFTRSAGRWTQAAAEAVKPLRGPIAEAVNERHIYVYGAGQDQARRNAEAAAAWSNVRARLNLTLGVKSDDQVTEEDIASSSLVLFGNQHTNRLIARFAGQLPMSLNPGAADYGLLFIAPLGKHYLLVSSGLPWWTGADEVDRGGYRFAPDQYRLLSTFGDYILFKGNLSHVLGEGRFDRTGKPPASLEASGVVTVR